MPHPEMLAIHVMKTAGTSLRGMVVDGVGADAVYPNDEDLREMHKGWYPGPEALAAHVAEGRHHDARVVFGHVPYVFVDALPKRTLTLCLLREPVARAVSMMNHRRTNTKRYRGATYEDLLDDETFVAWQLRDYQTKMFAFDALEECADSVNTPLAIDDDRFARALRRLDSVDVLGVVEDLPAFRRRLVQVTGVEPGPDQARNRGSYERDDLDPDVRRRLEELTAHDAVLYRRALEIVAAGGRGRGGWRGVVVRRRSRRLVRAGR